MKNQRSKDTNEMVIYQIYLKSFQDTDGDGIGDLNGIRKRLPYINKLGVDMIWITPFYPSPQRDNGYDISDYRAINPIYGTMEDFKALLAEAHEFQIGVMIDMVLNHTSIEHEWFQKALTGDSKYMDYYIFKDQPTNWESKFGGKAWEYVASLNKYYLHLYDVTQADLNWDNPEVRQEVADIVNFWLDLGVDGLRFDVINLISKPEVFKDAVHHDGRQFYTDGPRVHEYIRELNENSFGQKNIVTVGELSSTSIEHAVKYAQPDRQELSTVFGFHHLKIDYKNNDKWTLQKPDYQELKQILTHWQDTMQEHDATMALFWCNHDQPRIVSRLGDDTNYPYESATMLATLIHMLKGMPYIYQGEEIGLPNAYFEDMEEYRDVESLNMRKLLENRYSESEIMDILSKRSRDNGRTPIPWDETKNYGFTTGEPWIGFSHHPHFMTVKEALEDKKSIFHWYRTLISLRHQNQIVSKGLIEWLDLKNENLFNYKRILNQQEWIVINNLTDQSVDYQLKKDKGRIILSNYNRKTLEKKLTLSPFETIVIEYENKDI